jgi:hypothetical protein
MAHARKTAGDHSNMTSVFKPVVSYAKTVGSAFADFGRAYKKAVDASGDIMPGANARARAANKNYDAEKGQLMGAILQGRKYDNKTKKQIKKGMR